MKVICARPFKYSSQHIFHPKILGDPPIALAQSASLRSGLSVLTPPNTWRGSDPAADRRLALHIAIAWGYGSIVPAEHPILWRAALSGPCRSLRDVVLREAQNG